MILKLLNKNTADFSYIFLYEIEGRIKSKTICVSYLSSVVIIDVMDGVNGPHDMEGIEKCNEKLLNVHQNINIKIEGGTKKRCVPLVYNNTYAFV